MRKKFVNKSALRTVRLMGLAVCVGTLGLSSCTDEYDDSGLRSDIENLENRVTSLEEWQQSVNTDIQSLQTLVAALENRNYITGVVPLMENGAEVGYTITFQDGTSINIHHGKDGADGADGADGVNGTTPVIGVAQDEQGTYYWTVNGEFLTDNAGNKMPVTGPKGDKGDKGEQGEQGIPGTPGTPGADGEDGQDGADGQDGQDGQDAIAPQVRINEETNEWEISIDGGKTWTSTGVQATGDKGDTGATGRPGATGPQGPQGIQGPQGNSMFSDVDYTDTEVTFTLEDGTEITVPRISELLTVTAKADTDNTFTVTSTLLSDESNVVEVRVESANADGVAIISRAVETRWTVETTLSGNELTIVARPGNTVELNEKTLLKVAISNAAGKLLASGQTVFTNRMANETQAIVADKAALQAALTDETKTYIELQNNVVLGEGESLSITSNKTIDLNGRTLSSDEDGMTLLNITEGIVTFSNGNLKFKNTFAGGNVSDIVVGVDKSSDKSDEVISTATVIFNDMKIEGSVYVSYGSSVEINDSEITSELYGICTNANASDDDTAPINVSIKNTKLTAETPVFINIPANVEIDNCTITGGWQGVMLRGGTATIKNSTISLQRELATPVEGDTWSADKNSGKDEWKSGNEVAIAGITMGNNTTSAYQYPTSVTLENTSVSGYENYWAVYADATSVCTVTFKYDSECTFSPALDPEKSFKQGKGAGNNYISVTDGNSTETTY